MSFSQHMREITNLVLSLKPSGWAVLAVAALILALIWFALQKKDRVRAALWMGSAGFFFEAENAIRRTNRSESATMKGASKH